MTILKRFVFSQVFLDGFLGPTQKKRQNKTKNAFFVKIARLNSKKKLFCMANQTTVFSILQLFIFQKFLQLIVSFFVQKNLEGNQVFSLKSFIGRKAIVGFQPLIIFRLVVKKLEIKKVKSTWRTKGSQSYIPNRQRNPKKYPLLLRPGIPSPFTFFLHNFSDISDFKTVFRQVFANGRIKSCHLSSK